MNQFSLMSQQNSVSIFLCWSCLILCFASHTWTWNRNTLETVLNHEPDIRGCYYCEIIEKSLLHMLLVLSVCWERWLCWCCLLYCTESAGLQNIVSNTDLGWHRETGGDTPCPWSPPPPSCSSLTWSWSWSLYHGHHWSSGALVCTSIWSLVTVSMWSEDILSVDDADGVDGVDRSTLHISGQCYQSMISAYWSSSVSALVSASSLLLPANNSHWHVTQPLIGQHLISSQVWTNERPGERLGLVVLIIIRLSVLSVAWQLHHS